jgi:hypothetical protein
MSWPRAVGQVPIYFGQRPSGRPMNPAERYTSKYQDVDNTPLYAFGHGLTYGRFSYDELQVVPKRVREQDAVKISVRLRNLGSREAEETVFLFIRTSSAASPGRCWSSRATRSCDWGQALRLGELELPAPSFATLGRTCSSCSRRARSRSSSDRVPSQQGCCGRPSSCVETCAPAPSNLLINALQVLTTASGPQSKVRIRGRPGLPGPHLTRAARAR